jgi:hypothetical protein
MAACADPWASTQAEAAAARTERIAALRATLDAPGTAGGTPDRAALAAELQTLEAEAARAAAAPPKLTYESMLVEGFDVTVRACIGRGCVG